MTRPFPDRLFTEAGSYFLWTFLPILPPGDPRWDRCSFVGGSSRASGRGYSAVWEIRGDRLYLRSFGGAVRLDDPEHQYRRFLDGTPDGKIQVGMPDVHEVDEPIFASWVTDDLNCESWQTFDEGSSYRAALAFRLFRIEQGRVVDVVIDNQDDRHRTVHNPTELLNASMTECRVALAQDVETPPVTGLAEALTRQCEVLDIPNLFRLLWQAGQPDLDDLIAGFAIADDADVRMWIAYALGRLGVYAAPAVPMLKEALEATQHDGVLKAVAYALAGIGVPAAFTLPTMITMVEARLGHDANRQVRLLVDQLGAAGESSIGILIAGLLVAHNGNTQHRIAAALGTIGAVAVPTLVRAFVAAGTEVQRVALARAFGRIGRDASPALPLMLDGLEHLSSDWSRETFAEALAKIGLRSMVSIAPLCAALDISSDYGARSQIVKAIATLGRDAVDKLIQEFETAESSVVRTELVKVLGDLGPAAVSAVEHLSAAAVRSSDGALAREVAETLRKIGAPADLLATIQTAALKHERNSYRTDDILKKMRPGAVPTAEAIRDLVAMLVTYGMDPSGRHIAALLGAMGAPAVEPLLAALAKAEEPRARRVIVNALGQIGSPAAAALDAAIDELAAAPDDSTRLQLVDDVRRLGKPGPEYLETLVAVMRRSAFLPIWWRLGIVLADIGRPAVMPLIQLLEETGDDERRRALANALGQIGNIAALEAPALLQIMQTTNNPQTRVTLAAALRNMALRLAWPLPDTSSRTQY